MICKSGKVGYVDKIAAMLALAGCRNHRKGARQERRVYRCPECREWHLTSRSDERGRTDRRAAIA